MLSVVVHTCDFQGWVTCMRSVSWGQEPVCVSYMTEFQVSLGCGVRLPLKYHSLNIFSLNLFFIYACMFAHAFPLTCIHTMCIRCPQRPEEGARSSRRGPSGSNRTEPRSSIRIASTLNHWGISLGTPKIFWKHFSPSDISYLIKLEPLPC